MTASPTNAATTHHDQLAGNRASTLAQTDPEFTAYFENFASDEVLADSANLDAALGLPTRLMVQLAAILAAGGVAEFRGMAGAALATASRRSS